jgi:hypothetical protein
MSVIKLTQDHKEAIKDLFLTKQNYMGSSNFENEGPDFQQRLYEIFCDTYLSDLKNYHAFGFYNKETNKVDALISFYESVNDASWYLTSGRSASKHLLLKHILDTIMDHNEANGRLKFFTVMNSRQARLMRKLGFSKRNVERYDYFDEYIVNPKEKTFYSDHWEILFRRRLLPVETVVRCTFLKKEYRTNLPNGGNI